MKDFIEFMQFILPFLETPERPSFQTDHDILYLCGVKFKEMSAEDIRYCIRHEFIPGNGSKWDYYIFNDVGVSEDDLDKITDEQWDKVKDCDESGLTNCLHTTYYASC